MYKAEEEIEAISIILFQGKYQGKKSIEICKFTLYVRC